MRVTGALLFVILLSIAGELQPARAALPEAEQVFFVPLPEATVDAALTAVGATTTGTMRSVISITAVADDTIIYYDEWEDGFEPVLEEPAQSSTQIWGDEDLSNGIPPGFATDVIDAGDIVVLEDDVALPRDSGTLRYDGGDRFGATSPIAATRAVWDLGIGTVAAGAVEVSNVATYGTAYEVPAGVDFLYPSATDQMFEYTSLVITAAEDGTTVGIDVDADGTDDVTIPLDQGETHQVDGGVRTGATVTASAPVQVQLITGDIGARFETRFYNLVPTSAWNSTYYTPVGSSAANETVVVLYNPDTAALTVDAQTLGGSVPVVVPAGGAAAYVMPVDSGGRFTSSDGRPFEALSGIDTDDGDSTAHDWGFTLLPSSSLTASALAGWGPGSADLTGNGSPVWVTAVGATRIYVDYDGDPTTGLLTDPNGSGYDAHTDVSAFESLKLFDTFNSDNDQTGTRAYTVDGTLIAAAWGQDPDTADPGNPYLDLGTTILPVPLFNAFKSVDITNDVNANGYAEIGDTLRYTVRVSNDGPTSESFVILEDDLPVTTGYVENSTTVDGTPVPDDAVGTPSPFDEGGLDIGTIPPFSSRLVAFDALILSLPPPGEEISNEVTVNGSATVTDGADIPAGGAACAADLTNDSFSPVSIHVEGQTVYARVTDPDESGTITAQITSSASGDTETVVLTETGADTGVFTGSVPSSPLIGGAAEDGTLLAEAGETIGLDHTDPDNPDDTCAATVTVVPPAAGKPLYLSEPGQGLDRVDPVASGDGTTASSLVLDAVVDVDNLLDSFTTNQSFGGSDGSVPWVPDWQELGESDGPANGLVEVESRAGCPISNDICLEIAGTGVDLTGLGASRAADLSGAYSATLSFDYATNTDTGSVGLEVRPDGAVSWIPLATYALNPSRTGSASFDITSYISPNTEIRFVGSGSTAAFGGFYVDEVDIAWQTVTPSSTTFTQTDPMVMDFSVLSDQTAQVTAVVDLTSGSISSTPDVTATLSDGTTSFATLTSPSVTPLGGSTYELTWTGVVPADFTVTTGNRVSLEISTSEPGLAFQVFYDSATSPSQIILPTSTYISVDAVDAYDAAFPGGAPITNPAVGQVVHLRITASDPFGPSDITGLDLTVQDGCAGSPAAVSLDQTDVVATTGSSKTYEYAYTVPPGCFEDFTVLAVAFEGTEGITDSDSTTIGIDARPVLAVAKSGPAAALLGDTITYTFAVSHDAGSDGSPVAGLSVTDDVAGGAAYVSGDDGDGLLEAGETWSFTADYTTSGTDPDPLDNTVSVSGTDLDGEAVGPVTDTHSLDIRVAELQVIKTDTVNGTGVAGDTVDYEITVTSTGLVTVSNIAVSDGLADVDASLSCVPVVPFVLVPGASATCTGTHTVTQAEVDAGSVSNTATATGEDPSGGPVSDESDDPDDVTDVDPDGDGEPDDPTLTPLTQTPELQVLKNDVLSGTGIAGDTVDYGIVVTNTGTVTVSDIDVSDSLADVDASVSCLPVEPFSLAPGDSALCAGAHTVTQAEVDAGAVSNVATATGEDPSGGPVSDESDDLDDPTDVDPDGDGEPDDPTVTPLTQTPELQVTKTDTVNGTGVAGDTIDYAIVVTNTGTVTVSDIDVSDSLADVDASVSCLPIEPFDLAPGGSALCAGTHTVTQAEVDAGSVTNTATATGEDPAGDPVSDDSDDPDDPTDDDPDGDGEPDDPTVTPLTQTPGLQVTKTDTVNGTGVAGDTIDYAIVVTNTGTVTVSNIAVSDAMGDVDASLACLPAEPFSIAPGASAACTGTHTITQAEVDAGSVTNTATASGEDPAGDPVSDESDDPDDPTNDDPDGDGEPDDPTVTPLTQTPELQVTKTDSVNGTGVAGDTVDYAITVTNTGTVTVTDIDVSDALADVDASVACIAVEPFSLTPGDSALCAGAHTVTQAEVDAGSVSNTATATGEDPSGGPVSDESDDPDDVTDVDPDGDGEPDDPTLTPLTQTPELQVLKNDVLSGTGIAGDTVDYGITVTNTGTVTVTDIVVSDGLGDVDASVSCLPIEPFDLAPGASALCAGTHTVTQAEVDAGSVSNVATAAGEDPSGGRVSDESDDPDDVTDVDPDGDGEPDDPTVTPLTQAPELQVLKNDVLSGTGIAGDTVDYGITVTNTGTVTVSDIVVSDGLGDVDASVSCLPIEPFDLAPGASALCAGTHTVTQAEVDAGSVSNTATAAGEDPSGGPVSDESDDPDDATDVDPDGDGEPDDPTVTPLTQAPELQVTKTDTVNGTGIAGDMIDYEITVTNTGTVTVTDIAVSDAMGDVDASLACLPGEPFSIAPGASAACTGTHTITQTEVDAGSVSNVATATGEDPAGDPVSDESDDPDDATDADPDGDGEPDDPTVTPLTQTPELQVTKTDVLNGTGVAGDTIDYEITVTNTGTVTVTDIAVSDALADVDASVACIAVQPFVLLPGASATCTGTHTVTQAEVDAGSVSNTATAAGEDPSGGPVTDESDDPGDATDVDPDGDGEPDDPTVTPLNQTPELQVLKNDVLNGTGIAGNTVDYGITVANTGTVTVTDIDMSDSLADVDASLTCLPIEPFDLAPGASALCAGTHTITQAEVDAGAVSNTATASGDDPAGDAVSDDSDDPDDATDADPDGDGEPDDPTVTPLTQTAELRVSKTDTLSGSGIAGDTITYVIAVSNTGTVTMSNIDISDSLADVDASLSCIPVEPFSLAPGASAACAGTHTITQTEVDAGSVTNTATATGEDPAGNPVSDDSDDPDDPTDDDPDGDGEPDDPTVTPLTQTAELQVTKTDVLGGTGVAGESIDYSIVVVNTGTVTASDIDVSDSLADADASLSCAPTEPFSIAPGASASCTASHTITQAEVDAGSVANTATATGEDPAGSPVSDASDDPDDPTNDDPDGDGEPDDPTITPLSGFAELQVTKSDTLSGSGIARDTITYAITLANAGAVTISDIAVSDSLADVEGSLSCFPAEPFLLAPGATASCTGTHTVTQAEVDVGSVSNTATAAGEDPAGGPVSDDSDDPDDPTDDDPDSDGEPDDPTVTPLTRTAELQVTKTDALSGPGVLGDTVAYTIGVVNTGTVSLSNVTVTDSLPDADASLSCAPAEPFDIAPGASATCTATHNVTQAEVDSGSVANVATATGQDPDGDPVTDDSDDPDDPTDDDPDGDGEPDDPTVTPLSSLAELKVTKVDTLSGSGVAGDTIDYTITVTNTGTVTVSNIDLSDALADVDASLSCAPTEPFTLLPGASASCTGTHTVTQTEVDGGSVSNTATATGDAPGGAPVIDDSDDPDNPTDADPDGDGEPDDPTVTPLAPVTELQVTKTDVLAGTGVAGDTITYAITAVNTGTTTLSNLTVADPNADPGSVDCSPTVLPATLAPGESFICTATHTVTQAEVDAGSVTNTATVAGEDPAGDPVSDDSDDPDDPTNDDPDGDGEPDDPTVTLLNPVGELQVTKTDLFAGTGVAGDTISYTITVANTGTVTVSDIDLSDPNADAGSIDCSPTVLPATLAPGESFICTATHSVTQADVDAGSVENTATASGADPSGDPVVDDSDDPDDPTDVDPDGDGEPDDPTITSLPQTPELQVTKVDTLAGFGGAGDVITYAVTVINTGTVTVSDIVLTDPVADSGSISCGPAAPFDLAPGASASCTATHTITQVEADAGSVTNTATAGGEDPGGDPVSDDSDDPDDSTDDDPDGDGEPDDPTVTPLAPPTGLEVTKADLLAGTGVAADTITYSLTVTNTGLVTLSDVTVSDALADADASLSCAPAEPFVLAIGASASCTATHTVTQAEVDAGSVANTATATANDPAGNPVTDDSDDPDDPTDDDPDSDGEPDDPTVTPLNAVAELQVAKVDSVPATVVVGDVITYTITVVNAGSVTVDTFDLTDANADADSLDCGPSGPPVALAPGGSFSCAALHTITQSDLDAGEVANTATASGEDPNGNPVTDDSDDPDDPTNDDPDGDGEPDDPTISPLSIPPIAVDDTVVSPTPASPLSPTVVDVVANDRDPDGTVDPTTVSIVGGTDTDGDGSSDELVVPDEGTWTVDPTTGEVTFTPETSFEEDPTPITYTIDDDEGLTSPPATVTIFYPPRPTTVVGLLWMDGDGDGVQDSDEVGIPGVTVVLTCSGPDGELGTDDDTTRTTVTASPYSFDEVPIGAVCTVTIDETTLPTDLAQTFDPDDVLDAATSFTISGPVTGVDFGFRSRTYAPAPTPNPTPAPPSVSPTPAPPSPLPATGSDARAPVWAALVLVVLGAGLVLGSRCRRRGRTGSS